MPGGLWTGMGGKLAERWIAAILTPAFAFWAGGLVAWAEPSRWDPVERWVDRPSAAATIAVAAGALLLVTLSGALVGRLVPATIRALEGYWPPWLGGVRERLVRWRARWLDADTQRFQELAAGLTERSAEEQAEFARVDERRRRVPAPDRRMPTRLGDVLRAAEAWPRDKYGLDAPKCWPRLWLVLPDRARQDLTAARAVLDAGAAAWLWGVLFVVWTPWAWWAVPAAVAAAVGSYLWMLSAAGAYADLIESAFDVHRTALYEACRWPLPVDAEDERVKGEALTSYLWRGADGPTPLEPAGRETPADAPTS